MLPFIFHLILNLYNAGVCTHTHTHTHTHCHLSLHVKNIMPKLSTLFFSTGSYFIRSIVSYSDFIMKDPEARNWKVFAQRRHQFRVSVMSSTSWRHNMEEDLTNCIIIEYRRQWAKVQDMVRYNIMNHILSMAVFSNNQPTSGREDLCCCCCC